jgi:hypothetical protein
MAISRFMRDLARGVLSDPSWLLPENEGKREHPPQHPEDAREALRLALEQAQRRETAQAQRIEGARARAGTLIGVSGIGATFVGSRAADLSGLALYVSLGSVLLFVGAIIVALWAISPQTWSFGVKPTSVTTDWDHGVSLEKILREMTDVFANGYDENQLAIHRMLGRFNLAAGLLVAGLLVLIGGMVLALQ